MGNIAYDRRHPNRVGGVTPYGKYGTIGRLRQQSGVSGDSVAVVAARQQGNSGRQQGNRVAAIALRWR